MKKENLECILKSTDFYKYGLIDSKDFNNLLKKCESLSDDIVLYVLCEVIDNNLNSYLLYAEAMDYLSKNDRSLIRSKNLLLDKNIEIKNIESSLFASLCIKDDLKKELYKKISRVDA